MAVSYTYQSFANQIAGELGSRVDLLTNQYGSITYTLSPIQQAIQNAIAKWEREHFYFNEIQAINTFNTVVAQEYYTAISSPYIGASPHFDIVNITVSGNRYTLNPRTEQYISDISINNYSQGQPIDYALYAETMRLYPVPDGSYPITFEGTWRFPTLVNNTDTNKWLQDGADLIKAEAKMYLFENLLKQYDQADRQKKLIYGDPAIPGDTGYLYALRSEGVQRIAGGRLRASCF